jgi:hypothetical protein
MILLDVNARFTLLPELLFLQDLHLHTKCGRKASPCISNFDLHILFDLETETRGMAAQPLQDSSQFGAGARLASLVRAR